MSWCPQDHTLLLSCSKDQRTICWDVNSTDIVCEMPNRDTWSFDVQVGAALGGAGHVGTRVGVGWVGSSSSSLLVGCAVATSR
jgi:hypothetical protein